MIKQGETVYFVIHRLNQIKAFIPTEWELENINAKITDFDLQELCDIRVFTDKNSAIAHLNLLNEVQIDRWKLDIESIERKINELKNKEIRFVGR